MSARTSSLLLDEQPLQALPSLACKIGLNSAVFLQQVHYWIQKDSAHVRDGKRWIYNTYEDWEKQFPFWSAQVIRKRIVKPLEDAGILVTTHRYNSMVQDKTKWYTIDYDALNALLNPPDEATTPTLNPPDKITSPTGQSNQPRTGQNNHTVNQRLPETNYRDSVLQTDEPPKKNGSSQKVKPVSAKSFGVKRLVDAINAAKAKGKKPAPPDEPYKKRLGDRYAALLADGYEPEQLEPALEYLVRVASGEGGGWMKGKKLWRFLDEGVSYVETGEEVTETDEPMNPHGEKGTEARRKAYGLTFYLSASDEPEERIRQLLAEGLDHEEMCKELRV